MSEPNQPTPWEEKFPQSVAEKVKGTPGLIGKQLDPLILLRNRELIAELKPDPALDALVMALSTGEATGEQQRQAASMLVMDRERLQKALDLFARMETAMAIFA